MHATGFHRHDHAACIEDGLEAIRAHCRAGRLRLTPLRERVAEILLAEHRAMGAYDVLDVLRAEGLAAQPPAAYRALDFLVAQGFAHKVERLNAFVACAHPGEADHAPAFLVCRACRSVAEAPGAAVRGGLRDTATRAGFALETMVIEAVGLCPDCARAEGVA